VELSLKDPMFMILAVLMALLVVLMALIWFGR